MKRNTILILLFLLVGTQSISAQQVINLYEGKAPGSETWNWDEAESVKNMFNTRVVYNVSKPSITVFLPKPELATGTAVVVAPGGGFQTLSIDSEGNDVAAYLNSKGVAAFVLKYRVIKSLTNDPVQEMMASIGGKQNFDSLHAPVIKMAMQDGLTAVKYVRTHAKEYEIDTNKIGFMGFSAGGTVTMSVVSNATDETRPNFIAPIYAYLSPSVGSEIPKQRTPTFIVVASNDQLRLTPTSISIYNKWREAGQPVELHVYEQGGHGFGMKKQKLPSDSWAERFGDWLKMEGYLKKLHPNPMELKYSEEEIAEFKKRDELKVKNDWANLGKYKEANKKLEPPKPGENRVVFLGNSITEFWMDKLPEFFTDGRIARGISGQTSIQTLIRFRPDVINLKPKVVIINIGTNDIAENNGPYDPDFTIGNIKNMMQLAQTNNIKVILASVHPAFEFPWRKEITDVPNKILVLNERIKALANENKLVYLDYHTALKDERNGLSPDIATDGVHPTLAGYNIMMPLAEKAIAEAIKN